ncbi:iswi chromatin-remodeling complex atpase isw2 [Diplodia corticola]|uniref:Iswi chromatin-remodeling complex atpase isw2 n=1 Tax=Diplodia corticola TaxID=236234 RepID=A0A1J9SLP0_9PEZI|nr:iswi chromatin-remodeling complex atpase isw2 [Diplodia corticola]OJD40636.1 iswi chromatin-remodeling complex atpase isw2 [Diplodia corticola]
MDHPALPVQGSSKLVTPPAKRRSTYESLLNAFGAQNTSSSVTKARRSLASTESIAHPPQTLSSSPDPLPMPPQPPNTAKSIELDSPASTADGLDDPSTQSEDLTPRRSLRPRRNLSDLNYTDSPRLAQSSAKKEKVNLVMSDMVSSPKNSPRPKINASARAQIRADIESNTKVKRDAFLYRHNEYFLPLLPDGSYIAKLSKIKHGAFVPYCELDKQPQGITATLKPYQLSGLSFLAHMYDNGMPCMLGDEMGLGKTLQTLSLFQLLEERKTSHYAQNRPYLVVCPLSVVNSWVNEATRWTPELKVLRFHGPKAERDALKKVATGQRDRYGQETNRSKRRRGDRRRGSNKIINLDDDEDDDAYKIVITSYETFVSEQTWFKAAFVWRYIVLDEGHRVKNSKANVSHALQGLRAEYRLILTGTPLQNDMQEMWSLLHWLLPDVFTTKTAELFKNSFDLSRGQIDTSVMDHARRLLELLMLRRMKTSPGVDLNLPPKEEVLLYVPLTPLQRFWYLRLLTRSGEALLTDIFAKAKDKEQKALQQDLTEEKKLKMLEETEKMASETPAGSDVWEETREMMIQSLANERQEQKQGDWAKLMNLVMQLRKCCSHPYLLPGVIPDPYPPGDHVIRASGKFIVLEKLIQNLILERGKKVLIFSGFTSTLDLCEDLLTLLGGDGESFRYLRFDGSTERARRNLDVRLFNDKSTNYMAMIVSTRAGGLGINLTAATEAIFLDEDWNPQVTLQAEARAHRIGQTKPVTIYKLCTQGTVEEQMMGRIRKKLYLSAKITESMKSVYGSPSTKRKRGRPSEEDKPHLNVSQLKTLIRRGAQTLSHPEIDVTEMLSWDLETILEKCCDKPSSDKPSDSAVGEDRNVDEQTWLSSMEKVETAVFDGRRIQRNSDADHFSVQTDLVRNDRRKGKETTVMVGGFAVNKQSMACGEWEAMPTLAGKDPRLAEPVRAKRKPVVNQDVRNLPNADVFLAVDESSTDTPQHCQACWDGGKIWLCSFCPRSYHEGCLTDEQKRVVGIGSQFSCPQHGCADCAKRASEAGGMLYRCRFCPLAFCEDCLDFDRAQLIGDVVPEFELLGVGEVRQAYYVRCHVCADTFKEEPEMKDFYEGEARGYEQQWEEWKEMKRAKRTKRVKRKDSGIQSDVETKKEDVNSEYDWDPEYV